MDGTIVDIKNIDTIKIEELKEIVIDEIIHVEQHLEKIKNIIEDN